MAWRTWLRYGRAEGYKAEKDNGGGGIGFIPWPIGPSYLNIMIF